MLKRKYFFTYRGFWIPSFFVNEGFQSLSFKAKAELKEDIIFFYKKLLAYFKKKVNYTCDFYSTKSLSAMDYHIQEKGGIVDNLGNVHTTAQSYKNYLKENDLVIKDWADGTNKKQSMQLTDRTHIAELLNKYNN